jgi:energy-coupling factor transporter transmembrane protein EcfT
MHRLWAGTKVASIAVVALILGFRPLWPVIGAGAALVALAMLVARVPRGALPRFPRWFWFAMALGGFFTLQSAATPLVQWAGITVSLGGVEEWARLVALTAVVFGAAAVVSWTTPLADVAPALARLATPLRWIRLPVDEWATTIALSIRCLPLLIDEVRTLAAARRLRPSTRLDNEHRMRWLIRESHDMLFTALAVSLRRATEFGDAMEARGGFGPVTDPTAGPTWRDLVVVVLLAGLAVTAVLS